MHRYLRNFKIIIVQTFTTRLMQLNNNLPYFLPYYMEQIATDLSDDEIKIILYHIRSIKK